MQYSEKTLTNLMMLLRVGMGITELKDETAQYDPTIIGDVYRLAKYHDIAHIVANAVKKNKLECDAEIYAKLDKQFLLAMYRYQHQKHDLSVVTSAFEAAGIPHIPLKGSVLRAFYPAEWMRTGCDIDILVKPESLDAATSVLVDKCGYRKDGKTSHDVQFFSPAGTHIELHFDLIEDDEYGKDVVLDSFWDDASPVSGMQYRLAVSDEMFYYYHIRHMAKHVVNGGCGIRPFIDIWVMNNRMPDKNDEQRKKLLLLGTYDKFESNANKLSEVWFAGAEHTEASAMLAGYLLGAGVYGNTENRVKSKTAKQGSRLKYMLSRIFLSTKDLSTTYPRLEKQPWLMPLYQVRRWFRLVFCGSFKKSVNELKIAGNVSQKDRDETAEFFETVGIN